MRMIVGVGGARAHDYLLPIKLDSYLRQSGRGSIVLER